MRGTQITSRQIPAFTISLIIFLIAAILGWQRLHYGFNFIDEGYYMTEAWRLTVGDHLFQDQMSGAINFSSVMNSIFFRKWPNITLLGFRKIQYILTVCTLFFFSISLYKIHRQYWHLPLLFSIFAFTGLDPVGGTSNLSYYAYQNLFITLYLTFFLLGLHQIKITLRCIFFTMAGFFLWLISFNLLHLSLVIFSPLILFFFLRKWGGDLLYNINDLIFTLAPSIVCWAIFIVIFNITYIQNVISNIHNLTTENLYSPKVLAKINWAALQRIGIVSTYLIACLYCLLRVHFRYFLIIFIAVATLVFFIIDTSLFGLISYPYNYFVLNWPMWFSTLLVSFFVILFFYVFFKILTHRLLSRNEVLVIIIVLPCIIQGISSSIFSASGLLTILDSSIPIVGAIGIIVLTQKKISIKSYPIKFIILLILFAPFYYTTGWSYWRNTYFDVVPEQAVVIIDKGFGKGIRTNPLYKNLYEWINSNAELYTKKDDYIISYIKSPMVYMIAKRRPAPETSFIDAGCSASYYHDILNRMIEGKREPKMAFIFERYPQLAPLSLDKDAHYGMYPKKFTFPTDPFSQYITQNMTFLNQFQLAKDFIIRCYIRG
jgi:hypothetical protein